MDSTRTYRFRNCCEQSADCPLGLNDCFFFFYHSVFHVGIHVTRPCCEISCVLFIDVFLISVILRDKSCPSLKIPLQLFTFISGSLSSYKKTLPIRQKAHDNKFVIYRYTIYHIVNHCFVRNNVHNICVLNSETTAA